MSTLRLLVSYHYHRDTDLAALNERLGPVDLFADSGAFSAATKGATINLDDYAAWLRQWAPLLTVQANLDVIGDHEATAVNFDRLRAAGCDPMPTFHTGEPWSVLEELCAAHPYVALGGLALHAVGRAKQLPLMAWLVKAFKIAREHGTVFHAFGVTSATLIRDLPFYSLDSSTYTMGQRWGLAYIWDARALKMRSIFFRNSAKVRPVADLFRAHGFDPARGMSPTFMRKDSPTMAADRNDLTASSARAFQFMEATLQARHHVAAPPLPRFGDTGTKVYLALSGAGRFELDPLRLLKGPAS